MPRPKGLPAHYYAVADSAVNPDERDARAEAFFASMGARILNGGNAAFYRMASDHIQMPPFEVFFDAQRYYGTAPGRAV